MGTIENILEKLVLLEETYDIAAKEANNRSNASNFNRFSSKADGVHDCIKVIERLRDKRGGSINDRVKALYGAGHRLKGVMVYKLETGESWDDSCVYCDTLCEYESTFYKGV